jgi:tRNA threonylcarbamoyladenosine biosynthesis protein TsaB
MWLREQCILGIESSGAAVSVGLIDRGIPRGLIYCNDGTPGSQSLLVAIDRLLSMLRVEKRSLQGICVTLGPGAFTSLRIGLSTAEAMGLGLNVPVYGVETLALIAATVPFYSGTVKVIQNAYKGEFYLAAYRTCDGRAIRLEGPLLTTPTRFFEGLAAGDLVVGNGVPRLLEQYHDLAAIGVRCCQDASRLVTGIDVASYCIAFPVAPPSAVPLEPIYIRPSEAETNYERQFGRNGAHS